MFDIIVGLIILFLNIFFKNIINNEIFYAIMLIYSGVLLGKGLFSK